MEQKDMEHLIMEEFKIYLVKEKKTAENTVKAYVRDVLQFKTFLEKRGLMDFGAVTNADIVSYLMELKQDGSSKSTVNRKLASLRIYYNFLQKKTGLKSNPTENIKSPRIAKKPIDYLLPEQMETLMSMPDDTEKGIRDKAILELLYATGIRASELINMELADMNLRMGFVTCQGDNMRARIIPIGKMARLSLESYIDEARIRLLKRNSEETKLFVNCHGKPITRQGLWKILKEYGEKAAFEINLTPQVIRNSFAIHMLQNGADIKSLQELMGHEDISATQVYLAYTQNRIKDVYDKTHPRA
jgi:integrase/recombinase XerD